jgi:centromere/kinetochore protein ZW10
MAATSDPQRLGEALLSFSTNGLFPEDIASFPPVSGVDLEPALAALSKSQTNLVAEIHTINEETRDEVSSWVKNSKILQEDIIRSKAIANEIVRDSEAPLVSGEAVQNAEEKADFLNREVQYSTQLVQVLKSIKHVNHLLDRVEQASRERRVIDSLHLLQESWAALDNISASKSCRVMRLLDIRAFELKSNVHDVFNLVWQVLVRFDMDASRMVICDEARGKWSIA